MRAVCFHELRYCGYCEQILVLDWTLEDVNITRLRKTLWIQKEVYQSPDLVARILFVIY